jgi:hypothetical protein
MAIEDALGVIQQSWADIEPLLTVGQLRQLSYVASSPEDVRPIQVFDVVSAALPLAHPAWAAMDRPRDEPLTQDGGVEERIHEREQGESIAKAWAQLCIAKANTALRSSDIELEENADRLVEAAIRDIVSDSIVAPVADSIRETAIIHLRIDGQDAYPRFQFANEGDSPAGTHDVVRGLYEQLGGSDDPLGATSWWLTPNAWIGAPPAELLGLGRDDEINYAFQQIDNDSW